MADIVEKEITAGGGNVTVTTTSETAVATSPTLPVPYASCRVVIRGCLQLTTGAGTTTVTLRIRRGTDTTGALVGEANAITIGAAAGSTEQFSLVVLEERSNVASVVYTLTVQQAAATGNGTVLQFSIEVEVLNG